MVAIGGLTRLTESGLSIVDWHLVQGAKPPTSEMEWQRVFDEYKQSPEFKYVNSDFQLDDFKSIFWWEYIHRLFGRLIGVVFLIPAIVFFFQKRFPKWIEPKLILIFILGAFQGALGWYMVKSGLINEPRVSHFRLAAHLLTAFAAIVYVFWVALEVKFGHVKFALKATPAKWILSFLVLLIIQIGYGAFVAGLDAGKIHNFWPHMNPNEFIASNLMILEPWYENFINAGTGIQFVHRYLAIAVAGFTLYLFLKFKNFKNEHNAASFKKGLHWMLVAVIVQFILGVFTLINAVPISLGLLHQLGALVLLLSTVYTLYATQSIEKS